MRRVTEQAFHGSHRASVTMAWRDRTYERGALWFRGHLLQRPCCDKRLPNELLFDARAAACGNAPLRGNSRQGSTFCHPKLLVSLCRAARSLLVNLCAAQIACCS